LVNNFTARDGGQELPEFLAIDKGSKLTAGRALAEASHNTLRDVFLVYHSARRRTQTRASQIDQLAIVSLPQKTRGFFIARFESPEPVRNRLVTRHVRPPPKGQVESTCAKDVSVGPVRVGLATVSTI
jgi:hypothetical protein